MGYVDTTTLESLEFFKVTHKMKYNKKRLSILYNPDGSLTDTPGVAKYIPPAHNHLKQLTDHCTEVAELDDSVVCSKPIRKMVITGAEPTWETEGLDMKVALLADVPAQAMTMEWTESLFAKFQAFSPLSSSGQWEIPFLVGESYHLHLREALDWAQLTIKRSRMTVPSDEPFRLCFNHTDRRDEINVAARSSIPGGIAPNLVESSAPFGTNEHL